MNEQVASKKKLRPKKTAKLSQRDYINALCEYTGAWAPPHLFAATIELTDILEALANAQDASTAHEPCALRDVVQSVVEWNTKYPSSRIYGEGDIRRIAKEMDAIFEKAKAALSGTSQPPDDSEPTLEDWAPAIRDCLMICRDLIDGKNIDPKFLRISVQTILDEWPTATKRGSPEFLTSVGVCPECKTIAGFHQPTCGAKP
jgi:hypothetical protein